MNRNIKYTTGKIGRIRVVRDFLPSQPTSFFALRRTWIARTSASKATPFFGRLCPEMTNERNKLCLMSEKGN